MNPDLESFVGAGRLPASLAAKIDELPVGSYCRHKSWGFGRVVEWDLLGDRLLIDFVGKPAHPMKLEFAAKSLDPVGEDHIVARWLADPEAIAALAEDDPAEFVRATVASYGGEMTLDAFEDVVKGSAVPEGRFKSWWESAKRKLRNDRRFVVPSKRNLPLQLRDDDVSPSEAMVADVLAEKNLKAKVKALDTLLKDLDAFELPEAELKPVVDDLDLTVAKAAKLNPSAVIDLIIARDILFEHTPALREADGGGVGIVDVLKNERDQLDALITSLPVASQRRVCDAFPAAFGEGWVDEALQQLNRVGARGISEITRHLVSVGEQDALTEFLRGGIQHRSLSADVLVWVCKERRGAAAELFDDELAPCLIQSLERDYYDDETSRNNRLHDLILNDPELVPELMALCDVNQAKAFTRRLMGSPVFEELNRRSLLMRIVKVHPQTEKLVGGDDERAHDARLIVSWDSLEEKKKAYDKLVKSEIPENTKEIQIAREYGDLRENFEFKAAKQKQAVLMRLKSELEQDISNARGTDFRGVDTSTVNVGTRVSFEDVATSATQSYAILGAWDTNLENGVISYLSAIGDALLGSAVGESVQLPGLDEDSEPRTVKVVSIERAVD